MDMLDIRPDIIKFPRIVEPGSTYEVSVSIQEEENLASPVEFVAVPKFTIFSTVISEGEDITSETFLNDGGKKVWMKVIDVVHDEQSGRLEDSYPSVP
ncbi:hypothetical protein Tco_0474347 [Tanacetum coccineum]